MKASQHLIMIKSQRQAELVIMLITQLHNPSTYKMLDILTILWQNCLKNKKDLLTRHKKCHIFTDKEILARVKELDNTEKVFLLLKSENNSNSTGVSGEREMKKEGEKTL